MGDAHGDFGKMNGQENTVCVTPAADEAAHRWHMDQAIRVSRRALGDTAENPPVGCVIVRNGRVVGVGHTCCGGRPHAETQALAMAGERARGADVYVTLEPCAHYGRTPPCAEALAAAGVRRVFIAVEDPDPRVAGRGAAMLREAGIEVHTGLMAQEAGEVLAGYLMRQREKRPRVMLKLAISDDGQIAERPGAPTTITGPLARRRSHLLRAQSDAILVGVDTVIADDPMLTCRLPGLERRSPVRVVLDSRMRIPAGASLLHTPDAAPTWIATTMAGRERAREIVASAPHVRILALPHDESGRVSLPHLLSRLAEEGISNLLVEGGARVACSFVESGLVDAVALFRAPRVRLGEGVPALAGLPLERITGLPFVLREELPLGSDILRLYERKDASLAGTGRPRSGARQDPPATGGADAPDRSREK
jgi:diaminohydroxyphosphoribosylaminopyrimidine deaminase/5-amino-6-(5-phosphoribosylamino)uracil reductase